jgi:hypothetical protein
VARTKEFFGASGLIAFDEHGELDEPRIGVYRIEPNQSVFLGYAADLVRVNGHTPAWSIPPSLLNIA